MLLPEVLVMSNSRLALVRGESAVVMEAMNGQTAMQLA
jgi:hypothetical protein